MQRFIQPPLHLLRRPESVLPKELLSVVQFFDSNLDPRWEIYVQPHLNGLAPDLVLLNANSGIAIFEIIDSRSADVGTKLEHPIDKIQRVKHDLLHLYCLRLAAQLVKTRNVYALITAGVIDLGKDTTDLFQEWLEQLMGHKLLGPNGRQYNPISGPDSILNSDIKGVFPESTRVGSGYMSEQIARDLRTWLIEPDHEREQQQPLELNNNQKQLIDSRTATGYRRIRGPAGSGKSQVLAARASKLSGERQQVLVTAFNITLWHYLHDLALRYPNPSRQINNNVTWVHFHQWCKMMCAEAGLMGEYDSLWSQGNLDWVLTEGIPTLAEQALDLTGRRYDAVLLDEAQDFKPRWWKVLKKAVRENGEALIVADVTQDLYGTASSWTEEVMTNAGFSGKWSELKESYRIPPSLVPPLHTYVETFLPENALDPVAPQGELDLWPVKSRWLQATQNTSLAEIAADAVLQAPAFADPESTAISDIVVLTQTHAIGLRIVGVLERLGIPVQHIFDEDDEKQRLLKLSFFMGARGVKATTIKSFKGWEGRNLVVVIQDASDLESLAEIYVALSRVKRHHGGSYLTVVCSASELTSFAKNWPGFEELGLTFGAN